MSSSFESGTGCVPCQFCLPVAYCPTGNVVWQPILSHPRACQFCQSRSAATLSACLFPLLCHKTMLPANFLPASDSFVDTVRSANFANSASLPRFAATFASQTATFACHFCLLWWSGDPFGSLYKSDSGHCRTRISRSAYCTLNTERASNLARTLSWWDRRY